VRGSRIALLTAIPVLLLSADTPDPLAVELHRWSAFLQSKDATGDTWDQIKPGAAPIIARAEEALRDGRRFLALQRYAAVSTNLQAAMYANKHTADDRKNQDRFESEWKRLGGSLRSDLQSPSPRALEDIQPAAVRAFAETALPQVRGYYDASLDYSRATMPGAGIFYLGAAQAQRDYVDFSRKLSQKTTRRQPPLRSIDADLDSLERDLLALYRPPLSIDKHPEFIGASSMLKEARELNAAGLRYGALIRYLEAARRAGQLRGTPPLQRDELTKRLRDFEAKISAGNIDQTIGQVFVESAQSDVASPPQTPPVVATSIVTWVLPRYFAALEPAAPAKAKPAPTVSVTLVRWPYT
jgi:hypothetical protein